MDIELNQAQRAALKDGQKYITVKLTDAQIEAVLAGKSLEVVALAPTVEYLAFNQSTRAIAWVEEGPDGMVTQYRILRYAGISEAAEWNTTEGARRASAEVARSFPRFNNGGWTRVRITP